MGRERRAPLLAAAILAAIANLLRLE